MSRYIDLDAALANVSEDNHEDMCEYVEALHGAKPTFADGIQFARFMLHQMPEANVVPKYTMTDKEASVFDALNRHVTQNTFGSCAACRYSPKMGSGCVTELMKDLNDILNGAGIEAQGEV